jgi:hypothetical protein
MTRGERLKRLRKMAKRQQLILRRHRGGGYELVSRQPENVFLDGATLAQIEAELKEGARTDG